MPTYALVCWSCDATYEVVRPMSKAPTGTYVCQKCGAKDVKQFWPKDSNVVKSRQFEPYIDTDITGQPIEITSPKQRDKVLADNGCTMDTVSNPKRGGSRDKWEDEIGLDHVLEHIEKHGPEKPIDPDESF